MPWECDTGASWARNRETGEFAVNFKAWDMTAFTKAVQAISDQFGDGMVLMKKPDELPDGAWLVFHPPQTTE